MLISVWSNMHGQAGASATAAAVASSLALKTACKVLVAHNHIERSALEGYFFRHPADVEKTIQSLSNQGLDALIRLLMNGRLRPEMVGDYTYSLLKNHRLDVLAGTAKRERTAAKDPDVMLSIINCARGFYDLIILDVHSGTYENSSLRILENSDMIIFCINQNTFLLDDLAEIKNKYPFLKQKQAAHVISRYDNGGLVSRGNIARKYGIDKSSLFEFPNSTNFMDALNTGRVFEFIVLSQKTKDRADKALIGSLNRLCDFIVEGRDRVA